MTRIHRIRVLALACMCAIAPAFAADQVYRLDIKPQPLSAALQKFAEQSGLQIVYYTRVADGQNAHAVAGTLTAEEALRRLLAGTNLKFATIDPHTIAIDSADNPAPAPAGGNGGATGTGSGDRPGPGGGSSVDTSHAGGRVANGENVTPATSAVTEMDTMVVTGTRIRGRSPMSQPFTTYSREDIDRTGATSVDEFVRSVQSNFASVTADSKNAGGSPLNQSYGASVDLHGLGAGSTLTLLNGSRLPGAGSDGSFADISMLPLGAIERVEILSDGASAIYGADAVSGVVNFILADDFDGASTSASVGTSTDGGGTEYGVTHTMGVTSEKGSLLATFDYREHEGIDASDRDYIPDQPGPFNLVPEEARRSALVVGHYAPTQNTTVRASALASQRKFISQLEDAISAGRNVGDVKLVGAAGGIEYLLNQNWRAELTGNYGRQDEHSNTTMTFASGSFVTDFETRSDITTVTAKADGTLFELPSGAVRTAFGLEWRDESFQEAVTPASPAFISGILDRQTISAFGEILLPLVGRQTSMPLIKEIELSLAARYDDYSDFGSAINPKVGLAWRPAEGVTVRGTYGTSFRAPPLRNVAASGISYVVLAIPDPASPTGSTNTLFPGVPQNPNLTPEEARSMTFGFDLSPSFIEDLSLSATYFHVEYDDRIAMPPLAGNLFTIYRELDALGSFVILAPTPQQISDYVGSAPVNDIPGDGVGAIFDYRLKNISSTKTDGVDFAISYTKDVGAGDLTLSSRGTYLIENESIAAPGAQAVDMINVIFRPANLRARTSAFYQADNFVMGLSANYVAGYDNTLSAPASKVGSWTTADLHLSYDFSENSPLSGTVLALTVQNLTDKAPPFVEPAPFMAFYLGYDPTNASARGRFVSLQLTHRW